MIKVSVPATSANIGPGFDTLGVALNLYNKFTFEQIPNGLEIFGCHKDYINEENIIYTSMIKTFNKIGYPIPGVRITINSDIPICRGLGSSAACILGGVIGANQMAGGPLSKDEILEIATEIEGHPDNIAPALFGGLVVSIMDNKKINYNHIEVAKGIKLVALIPEFKLSTSEARKVLPSNIPYGDAVYNVGRVSLLLSALVNGRFDLLKHSVKDALHQDYRGKLIPNFTEIINKCNDSGSFGAFLSGAGPTIMVFVDEDDTDFIVDIKAYLGTLTYNWDVKELSIDTIGSTTV